MHIMDQARLILKPNLRCCCSCGNSNEMTFASDCVRLHRGHNKLKNLNKLKVYSFILWDANFKKALTNTRLMQPLIRCSAKGHDSQSTTV